MLLLGRFITSFLVIFLKNFLLRSDTSDKKKKTDGKKWDWKRLRISMSFQLFFQNARPFYSWNFQFSGTNLLQLLLHQLLVVLEVAKHHHLLESLGSLQGSHRWQTSGESINSLNDVFPHIQRRELRLFSGRVGTTSRQTSLLRFLWRLCRFSNGTHWRIETTITASSRFADSCKMLCIYRVTDMLIVERRYL